MASLKDLKNRISSVKSTRKITSAMKMVAAAKLRRAQEQAEAARPYAERMERMLRELAASTVSGSNASPLLTGTGKGDVHLAVIITSDRGLCGGFNAALIRKARADLRRERAAGKTVKILCVGRKGRDQLRREFGDDIIDTIENIGRPRLTFADADRVAGRLLRMFDRGAFDIATVYFSVFKSVIAQIPTAHQLVPFAASGASAAVEDAATEAKEPKEPKAIYEFEPNEEAILAQLLPRNVAMQIYRALLESQAGEHGARMSAMDNATRNAGDMIDKLSLEYNRTRQAAITSELIEIISGAEAL